MESRTYRQPSLVVTEHTLGVPLDHAAPDGEQIDVFARAVVAADRATDDLPWLVFLQGGPGFEGPRPETVDWIPWLPRALADHRVLLLDQRGMGRSTAIGPRDAQGSTPEVLADRLALHRADAIVEDAECFRQALEVDRWSVLGQSFGGFCSVAYLSTHPDSLRAAYITGGLPPLDAGIDEVYRATYRTVAAKTAAYYDRYPEDRDRMAALAELVTTDDVRLPGGDRLTHARLRHLGILLGMGPGPERLHHILELSPSSPAFLADVEHATTFARNPLYAVIHESCYANGITTAWSADRLLPEEYAEDATLLTGEHIYPWMFDDMAALHPFREAAHLLADRPWSTLYDDAVLADNDVPCAAAVYVDDMYVPREFSEDTSRRIRGMRPWITNEYEHDGVGAGGEKVLDRLIALAAGRA
ncbi:MAG TPA: alpha/beta fold hydrolase [Candidatus Nanopelagicales bacterium]|nr:alpha/beta fold hydrolase [Candidatus Nanopelagicales bacterium]